MRGEVDGEDLPRRMLVNRVHEDLQFEDPMIVISNVCNDVPGLTWASRPQVANQFPSGEKAACLTSPAWSSTT